MPILGPLLYYYWAFPGVDHWAHSLVPALHYTWFDTDIMNIGLIVSIIFTVITTALLAMFLYGWLRDR